MNQKEAVMDFMEYWANARLDIDEHLAKKIPDIFHYRNEMQQALAGGKRVRGTLTLLVCEALGGKRQDALDRAAAIEFVHAASLVHDDIIDGDEMRRGQPALWRILDPRRAILLADVMFASAQAEMDRMGREEGLTLAEAIRETAHGAAIETKEDYMKVIPLKTGALFGASAKLGAVAAKASQEVQEQALRYGLLIGESFQMADDVVEMRRIKNGEVNLFKAITLLPNMILQSFFGNVDLKTEEEKLDAEAKTRIERALGEIKSWPQNEYSAILREAPSRIMSLMYELG